jgi:hypothetical protein
LTSVPLLAAVLAVYFGARILSRRRQRNVVRLRGGGRVKLLSSVALLDGSEGDLLALEYASELTDPTPDKLWQEARTLVQTVGSRAEYATCRSALVSASVRRTGERGTDTVSQERTFTFARSDSGSGWQPADE